MIIMNEMNQIPNEIFNLVESKAWSALDDNERAVVLMHLTMEEYNNLHEIFMSTVALNQAEQHLYVPASIKENLDKAFKKQHQKSMMIPLWQAAAVFLMMIGGFAYYVFHHSAIEKVIVNTIHDTLYVPQLVSNEVKKTDTLIVYRYVNAIKSNNSSASKSIEQVHINETSKAMAMPVSQIRTLSQEEIKRSIKNAKNKSMLEDTLYHKIGYASI
jgi:hypothetical protein